MGANLPVDHEASDRELVLTRVFAAPRALVFDAWTRPERLARWWGPRGFTNTIHQMDVRPGGAWRIVQRAPDGSEHPFKGTYAEVRGPERLVLTQCYDVPPWSGHEALITVTFSEQAGRTTLTMTTRFASAEDRDAALAMGMRAGSIETLDRLAEYLFAAAPADREILAARVFDAPRDLVFRMWTEPEHVVRWWGPNGFTTTIAEMDVRPGGVWRFVMHGPDGTDYDNEIVYREVQRPERLVYAHTNPPFQFEATFVARGDRTEVTVRMSFESAELRERVVREHGAAEGLKQTLERLAAHLAAA